MIDCTGILRACGKPKAAELQAKLALMKQLGARGFPTVVFLGPDGSIIQRTSGAAPAESWLQAMRPIAKRFSEDARAARGLAKLDDEQRDRWIEERIAALGDDDWARRERATSELSALRRSGEPALAGLRKALERELEAVRDSDDAEVRARLRVLDEELRVGAVVVTVEGEQARADGVAILLGPTLESDEGEGDAGTFKVFGSTALRAFVRDRDDRIIEATRGDDGWWRVRGARLDLPFEIWIVPGGE